MHVCSSIYLYLLFIYLYITCCDRVTGKRVHIFVHWTAHCMNSYVQTTEVYRVLDFTVAHESYAKQKKIASTIWCLMYKEHEPSENSLLSLRMMQRTVHVATMSQQSNRETREQGSEVMLGYLTCHTFCWINERCFRCMQ